VRQRDALQAAQAAQAAEYAAERTRLAQQIDAQQHEIERRASLRWWLALPWRRIRAALKHTPPLA
jgi:hypothetical protein